MDAYVATRALAGMSTEDAREQGDARELILLVRRGDTGAFEILMRQNERLVLGTALRLLGQADDAKDAAQEVFLRLFRYAGSLDPDQPLAPWLYRVTVNVCSDAVRRRTAARHVFSPDDPAHHEGGATDDSVEGGLLTRQRRAVLQQALARMPERERLALVLRDIEGLETHEVARMLGTSEVTVRTQVSRGRLRLKRLVDRYDEKDTHMSCADIERRVALYAGGDLDELSARDVERHLATCDACRVLLTELRVQRDAMAESRAKAPSQDDLDDCADTSARGDCPRGCAAGVFDRIRFLPSRPFVWGLGRPRRRRIARLRCVGDGVADAGRAAGATRGRAVRSRRVSGGRRSGWAGGFAALDTRRATRRGRRACTGAALACRRSHLEPRVHDGAIGRHELAHDRRAGRIRLASRDRERPRSLWTRQTRRRPRCGGSSSRPPTRTSESSGWCRGPRPSRIGPGWRADEGPVADTEQVTEHPMKKPFTLAALVVALFLAVPIAAAARQAPAREAQKTDESAKTTQARVFQIAHASPRELAAALQPLGSREATIVANNTMMTIAVRDYPENLAAIESVIKLLDKPRPAPARSEPDDPLEVQISLIAASPDEGFKETPAPAALAPVLAELRKTLSFKRYRYVTTLTQRVRQGFGNAGGGGGASGFIADPFKLETPGARPARYQYKLKDPFVQTRESGAPTATLQLEFSLALSRVANQAKVDVGVETPMFDSQKISISTGLTFREGEQVVVGTSSAGEGDKSIIVVLTMRRVKM